MYLDFIIISVAFVKYGNLFLYPFFYYSAQRGRSVQEQMRELKEVILPSFEVGVQG